MANFSFFWYQYQLFQVDYSYFYFLVQKAPITGTKCPTRHLVLVPTKLKFQT